MERATLSVKVNGRHLRQLRKQRGESVSQIARQAEISVQYLSAIERGNRNPLPAVFERICDAMQLCAKDRRLLVLDDGLTLSTTRRAS